MHDLLAANPGKLEADHLAGYAKTLGLDAGAFAAALKARTHRGVVERDVLEAKALGAAGTLTLFINGRRGNGVPPVPVITNLIRNLLAGGDGSGPAPVTAGTLDLSDAPIRGAADAPVTIVEFSDFQCGFCFRVNPTLAQLLDRYQGKVRLVFKHSPIEGHTAAPLAHRAAFAAQQQGKFWEMHDRIFANQRAMDREALLAHASALGLDLATLHRRSRQPARPGRARPRPGGGRQGRRRRHADVLRQRHAAGRRAAARGVHRRHRQGPGRRSQPR